MKRRRFIQTVSSFSLAAMSGQDVLGADESEELIDVHQHLAYLQRPDDVFLKHQAAMGISKTVLLPAGRPVLLPATWQGKSNGLAANVSGNEAAARLATAHPDRMVFFANEVPSLDGAKGEIEKWLKQGAVGIGEQKFALDIDGPEMCRVYDIAKAFDVPVLIHIEHAKYNLGFDRFHKTLERYSDVNFIGHAQTWWGNIDKHHEQTVMYPKGKVTPGGITDRLLADYPNMYGDLSAGSGRNAISRDEVHGAAFFKRHQDKLLFGTDCPDLLGQGDQCIGTTQIAQIRRLVPDRAIRKKIFSANARKIIRFG